MACHHCVLEQLFLYLLGKLAPHVHDGASERYFEDILTTVMVRDFSSLRWCSPVNALVLAGNCSRFGHMRRHVAASGVAVVRAHPWALQSFRHFKIL
jgi:hypothetical protein